MPEKIIKRVILRSFSALVAFSGLNITFSVAASAPTPTKGHSAPEEAVAIINNRPLPIQSIRNFAEVYESIRDNYVDDVNGDQLFDDALKGMVGSLDPYSQYLDEKDYAEILNFTDGDIAKVGISVKKDGDDWVISAVDQNGAAKRAGLAKGQKLKKIDNKNVQALSHNDIEQMLRGPIGSSVRLQIQPSIIQSKREVTVLRTQLEKPLFEISMTNDGIAIVKIQGFQTTTGQQLINKLIPLLESRQLKGVVLDLRDNPGGLLSSAVEVADYFLDDGIIVSSRGRNVPEQKFQSWTPQKFPGIPVVAIINQYSASAAEVLAAALQDHKRATIVGQTSYGKGSIQKLWPLDQKRAVKMTVARYYTPNGKLIEGIGVVPDIPFPATTNQKSELDKKESPEQGDVDATLEKAVKLINPASTSVSTKVL